MKSPLVIVLVAIVLVAVSALTIMNNACKSSQHAWCAPTSVRHIKTGFRQLTRCRYLAVIDFDQIAHATGWARVVLSGASPSKPLW